MVESLLIPQSELASVGVLADSGRDEVRFAADFGGPTVPGTSVPGAGARGCPDKKLFSGVVVGE